MRSEIERKHDMCYQFTIVAEEQRIKARKNACKDRGMH